MAKEQKNTSAAKAAAKEPEYKATEFAMNAVGIFNTRPECVLAALKLAGKDTCTLSEAKDIVNKFLKKEVK